MFLVLPGTQHAQASITESMATAARRSAATGSRNGDDDATVREGLNEEEQEAGELTVRHARWPVVV